MCASRLMASPLTMQQQHLVFLWPPPGEGVKVSKIENGRLRCKFVGTPFLKNRLASDDDDNDALQIFGGNDCASSANKMCKGRY
jgi:hypothetical protein